MKDNIQEGLTRGQEQIFKGYVSKALTSLDDVHYNCALCTCILFHLYLVLTLEATDAFASRNTKLSRLNTKKCQGIRGGRMQCYAGIKLGVSCCFFIDL